MRPDIRAPTTHSPGDAACTSNPHSSRSTSLSPAVTFYDAFFHDGAIYLALEYMDCGSLEGLLRAASQTPGRLLPEGVHASILFQILQGLTYLHRERHSVHRDLKPANVLLDSAGFVKLSDFGISKQLGSGTYAQAGTQVGTLAYMSPERVKGEAYAFASDVWSVGLIALEAALGSYPFPGCRNYFDLVRTIVDGPAPTEAAEVQQRLPADLLQLVHACLQKAAAHRPDVLSLTRFPWLCRHAAAPTDLRAYLGSVAPLLAAQQPSSAGGGGGGGGGGFAAAAAETAAYGGDAYAQNYATMGAEQVLDESMMDEISEGPRSSELG